ncbi:hypothetical protein LDENG_00232140 [Lucifuga dentata]|nr:hypothetical protein LDENG_00232140 [Lucifuga dentata]
MKADCICHPELRSDDGSIPKHPDETESGRRHSGQHGRMSRTSRGQAFSGETTDRHCWNLRHFSTQPTENGPGRIKGRDKGVEAKGKDIYPLLVSYFVGEGACRQTASH